MAIPDTGFDIGAPLCISAIDPEHTEAMDDEPLDSKISDTIRMV
jgi:hypothetical protein